MGGVVALVVIRVRLTTDSMMVVRCDICRLHATTMTYNGACIDFLSPQARLSDSKHDHY